MGITAGLRAAAAGALLASALALVGAAPPAAAAAVVNVPSDAPTIQGAVDTVAAGGTVVVAPGVYHEQVDFHGRDLELRSSAGPMATVIDAGGAATGVTIDGSVPRATALRGFTIRGATGVGLVIAGGSPTIEGNIVTGNSGTYGGGLTVFGGGALIKDNIVRGNTAALGGGIYVADTSGAEVVGNTIEGNTAMEGGGMATNGVNGLVILDNVFRQNSSTAFGGAISTANHASLMITQNVFVDNESGEGGALAFTVPFEEQGPKVVSNTLVGNRAPGGSAIQSGGDYFAVDNILSGPADEPLVMCGGTGGRLFYNDLYNGTPTPIMDCPPAIGLVGNISVDPSLASDFSLEAGSPAIDAGHDDPLSPVLQPVDARGTPRVGDGNGDGTPVVDLGAFEWPGAGSPSPPDVPASYHPLTPARLLDTRIGVGASTAKLGTGATLALQVAGRGGVPAAAVSAVVLNVTVTDATGAGYVTAWPAGDARPLASNLNYRPARTVANLVTVKVGVGGVVDLYASAATHLVADVAGWYGSYLDSAGATYTPLPPVRVLDTRTGLGAPPAKVGNQLLALQVAGQGGVPASGVSAVALNVTVTDPNAESFLTVWPTDVGRPLASNLNYLPGQTVPNLVIVKLGKDGKVDLFNNAGTTNIVADVAGWFGADSVALPGTYNPVLPARILDTRTGVGAPAAKVGPGATLSLSVDGVGGVPAGAVAAVVLNVTVADPSAVSFLTAWPDGDPRPLASNLNYVAGQTVPNLVVVKVGVGGKIDLFNDAGATDVVVDVAGWYGS
ncbi:MAG TPA: right-handed parallel beta-helix repeat-containing protein [Acidimicrobiales bacterium]|nr:right-handed parallel beta-helix repeat-containing protein [Acidimicrobiales bacterium]